MDVLMNSSIDGDVPLPCLITGGYTLTVELEDIARLSRVSGRYTHTYIYIYLYFIANGC
jgi:hypothetical protein